MIVSCDHDKPHTKGVKVTNFRDIASASAELSVTIGIIEAAVDQDAPEEVKENFQEKVEQLHDNLRREIEEFIAFGEAYDRG